MACRTSHLSVLLLGLVALACAACTEEPHGPLLLVSTHRDYLQGIVLVDGKKQGEVGEYAFNRGLLGEFLGRRHRDSPLKDLAGLNIALRDASLSAGVHLVQIQKPGLTSLSAEFEWPFRGSAEGCMVALMPTFSAAGDECEVRRGGA